MAGRGGGRRGARGAEHPEVHLPVAHGWRLFAHPLLVGQLERLVVAAEREREQRSEVGPNARLLAHVLDLMVERIPADPGAPAFRHGGMLDGAGRAWFRGKTGGGRYRLFYRFSSATRVIVFAWLNVEHSLRTRGARTDAYATFARMLAGGMPPDNWEALLAASADEANLTHWQEVVHPRRGSTAR